MKIDDEEITINILSKSYVCKEALVFCFCLKIAKQQTTTRKIDIDAGTTVYRGRILEKRAVVVRKEQKECQKSMVYLRESYFMMCVIKDLHHHSLDLIFFWRFQF